MTYPSYLIHFNPNHDPKTGRFDFSSKYSADLIRKKAANKDYDPDLQRKMRIDFNKAYQQQGAGSNVKAYNIRSKALEKEANKLGKEEYNKRKKNELLTVDDYCDIVWAWMNQLEEKYGFHPYESDIAHLMDLGYSKQDAADISEWFHHSLVWDYVYNDKFDGFYPKNVDIHEDGTFSYPKKEENSK